MTETMNTEAVAPSADVETAAEDTALKAIAQWDSAKAGAEDAPVGPKLLNQVVPLFKSLGELAETFNAATDVDEAVKNYKFAEDSEEAKLAKQVEQAKALIAKNEAILAERARAAVIANVAPDFDEAKVKAEFKDTKTELRTKLTSIRDTFEMLGYVEYDISPAGRKTNYRGTNTYGDVLVHLFEYPSIDGGAKATGGKVDEEAKAERKAAKQWGKENGWEVADKGQISKDLLNAYRESLNS